MHEELAGALSLPLVSTRTTTDLFQRREARPRPVPRFAANDVAAAYRELQERGASFQCELVASDDGGSFFMVADPDGNTFKIVQGESAAAAD